MDALKFIDGIVGDSISRGESPSRVALIGRKRSQIIPYQIYFASKDIPFCAAEDLQVFLSDTFDRLLEILTIKADCEGRKNSRQVTNGIMFLCDLVKRFPLSKANKEALRSHLSVSRSTSFPDGVAAVRSYRGELKGKNVDGVVSSAMAEAIQEFIDSETVSDALMTLSQAFEGLQYDFGKSEEDIFYTDPPFFQLAEFARQYGTDYDAFVEDIEQAKETLVYVPPFEDGSEDDLSRRPLHLMTALRAKGKEFDKVILLDVHTDIWPNKNAHTSEQLEAERRVFYVAVTRAKEHLMFLTTRGIGWSPYIDELDLEAE